MSDKLLGQAQDVAGEVATSVQKERDITPMSMPVQKLEVPEIPGYVMYWMRGTPDRLGRAMNAGYEFVSEEEVCLNNFDLGGDGKTSGNTDMGTRVSVIAGKEIGADGQPVRLYLMKVKKEYYEISQRVVQNRNEAVAAAIRGGQIGAGASGVETPADIANRYAKGASADPEAAPRVKRPARTMFHPR